MKPNLYRRQHFLQLLAALEAVERPGGLRNLRYQRAPLGTKNWYAASLVSLRSILNRSGNKCRLAAYWKVVRRGTT